MVHGPSVVNSYGAWSLNGQDLGHGPLVINTYGTWSCSPNCANSQSVQFPHHRSIPMVWLINGPQLVWKSTLYMYLMLFYFLVVVVLVYVPSPIMQRATSILVD